ncbi:MAG: hypothetical protein JXR60_06120 [Bacteroidales bacterium]|nr:hypothetical protein [Bacteroidales bacterium]
MTKIESSKRTIGKSSEDLYNLLSNFNNFEHLMPERVTNWSSDENHCRFTISGIASLGMEIIERVPYSKITMRDYEKVPFKFNFLVLLSASNHEQTEVQLVFEADLNPMLKMVAKQPLTDFLEKLLDHLQKM